MNFIDEFYSSPMNTARANILLVDDTPNNLRLLSAMLIDQGYEVRRVISGQMALKTAQANPPDLILLDIKMPDMNGYEVCQHLKSTQQTQAIPVIFISALDEVLDKVKAFAVGGVDYITKPFSEEEVFARVENILTVRKLQRQLQAQNELLQRLSIERQQLVAKLATREAAVALFNNLPAGIFQIQRDGLFLAINQRLVELLGHQSDLEIIQRKYFSEYFADLDLEQVFIELQSSYTVYNHRTQLHRSDSSNIWGLVSMQFNQGEDCYEGAFIRVYPETKNM